MALSESLSGLRARCWALWQSPRFAVTREGSPAAVVKVEDVQSENTLAGLEMTHATQDRYIWRDEAVGGIGPDDLSEGSLS